jgi:cellulose biosynthesis protein BcsQ
MSEPGGPRATIYAFVSAKGGTGKTVIVASACHLLARAGKKVLAIDTDFSTRGLSLYLLGGATASQNVVLEPRNALAESYFEEVPISDISPRVLTRDGVRYNVLLSNTRLFRGGVPDERFLEAAGGANDGVSLSTKRYWQFLARLCDRFRSEYDYILIDTRGGVDFTSAAPAAIADGYIVITEADALSFDQIPGLRERISDFAERHSPTSPTLAGFIVNKALARPLQEQLGETLSVIHGGRLFGIIPSDPDAVRAYQAKEIPHEQLPDADFSYFCTIALTALFAPEVNWSSDAVRQYRQVSGTIVRRWRARRRMRSLIASWPSLQAISIVAILVSYYAYTQGRLSSILTPYNLLIATVLLSLIVAAFTQIARQRDNERSRLARLLTACFASTLLLVTGYVGFTLLPKALRPSNLLAQRTALIEELASTHDELSQRSRDLAAAQAQVSFQNETITKLRQQVTAEQRAVSELQGRILTLERATAAAAFFEQKVRELTADRDVALRSATIAARRVGDLEARLRVCATTPTPSGETGSTGTQ